jgi:hypothetical protein
MLFLLDKSSTVPCTSGRLGDVLEIESMGRKVDKACIKGWRPTKSGVKKVVQQLGKKVVKDSVSFSWDWIMDFAEKGQGGQIPCGRTGAAGKL